MLFRSLKKPLMLESNITAGDYLSGFFLGTRQALFDNGRESITLTVDEISPARLGSLIAVFERAVGFYASFLNLNAYHQPGVEAGKQAAEAILDIERSILDYLSKRKGTPFSCAEIATELHQPDEIEHVFKICRRLSQNMSQMICKTNAANIFENRYSWVGN